MNPRLTSLVRSFFEGADITDWEPSSQDTARIPNTEFEDGYFGASRHPDTFAHEIFKLDFGIPRLHIPVIGNATVPWIQQSMNATGNIL